MWQISNDCTSPGEPESFPQVLASDPAWNTHHWVGMLCVWRMFCPVVTVEQEDLLGSAYQSDTEMAKSLLGGGVGWVLN